MNPVALKRAAVLLVLAAVIAVATVGCRPSTPPTFFGPPCPYGQRLIQKTPAAWPTCARTAR